MHGKDELCIKSSSTDSTPIKHEQEEDFVMETLEFTPFSSEEPAVKVDILFLLYVFLKFIYLSPTNHMLIHIFFFFWEE
jgi:hypothetical protein